MTWFTLRSLVTLVLAFLLGALVGWLVWARRRTDPGTVPAVAPTSYTPSGEPSAEDTDADHRAAGAELSAGGSVTVPDAETDDAEVWDVPDEGAPAPAAADAIERIEGVGPKTGAALRAAGLGTYAAIAEATQEALRDALSAAGLRSAPSLASWSSQARLLADGNENGFRSLTRHLVAGRIRG